MDPVVISPDGIARMPAELRMELGVEDGGAKTLVAVAVPASDAAEAARLIRLVTLCLASEENRTPGNIRSQTRGASADVRSALLKKQYLHRREVLEGNQIMQILGRNPGYPHEILSRWEEQGRIFGVPLVGRKVYPAFQFAEGRPRAEIARVMAALSEQIPPWDIAFWFATRNEWLENDAPPQDALHDMANVLAAAADLASYPVF